MLYTLLQDLEVSCVKNAMTWKGFVNRMQDLYSKIFCKLEEKMPFISEPTLGQVMFILVFYVVLLCFDNCIVNQIVKAYLGKIQDNKMPCIVCGVWPTKLLVDATGEFKSEIRIQVS